MESYLNIKDIIGRKIISASINDEKDFVILETKSGPLYLTWTGDCCAHCYLANVSGSELLIGSTILEAENMEWKDVKRDEEECEVIESMGTKIKTSRGYVNFESRLKHNGYYGGQINISSSTPLNQYGGERDNWNKEILSSLKDF